MPRAGLPSSTRWATATAASASKLLNEVSPRAEVDQVESLNSATQICPHDRRDSAAATTAALVGAWSGVTAGVTGTASQRVGSVWIRMSPSERVERGVGDRRHRLGGLQDQVGGADIALAVDALIRLPPPRDRTEGLRRRGARDLRVHERPPSPLPRRNQAMINTFC